MMEDHKADATATPATPSSNASGSGNATLPPTSTLRYRLPQRDSASPSPRRSAPSPLARRRSSILSYSSIEDLRQSFTDDFVNPKVSNATTRSDETEVTHWHSTPLAFAILPALGGVFFKDGKAFTSDILLLALAAIFLNWSIRLPWDWYYSAQSLRSDIESDDNDPDIDEAVDDTAAGETASSIGDSPVLSPRRRRSTERLAQSPDMHDKREEAAGHLRRQEALALLATFLFPVAAAYLLHVVRAQLSQTSGGLVSDYNLSIFLLAAEIRPCRQVVRLISHRTLHLQRTVVSGSTDDPFAASPLSGSRAAALADLTQRLAALESQLADPTTLLPSPAAASSVAQNKTEIQDLSLELRKRYEPRLEGLERAVRRYEKRSTTLAIATEQRLQGLEHRIHEALSLAAVAAQHSQRRGPVAKLLDVAAAAVVWPVTTAWTVCASPVILCEELYARAKGVLLGTSSSSSSRSGKRKSAATTAAAGREKVPVRKVGK